MKKTIKSIFYIILGILIYSCSTVYADSGLDSNYQPSESLISSLFSLISPIGKLLTEQPGSEDYIACHIIISIICIITLYTITAIYIFKMDTKQEKKSIIKLLISLIPTSFFTLICILTELPLILYIFILIIYIIIFIVISKIIIKNKIKKSIYHAKEIDNNFDEDSFNKEAFDIYKEIQLSWMNFDFDKLEKLISKEMFNKYKEQLKELKKNNQKNIMDEIEYKSNKIIDVKIKKDIETIRCEMSVTCYDYIIDDNENVVKGKKDKKYNYLYELVFNKNIKKNKCILVKKNLKKIK